MFFHQSVMSRRRRNKIVGLFVDDTWSTEEQVLKGAAVSFFKNLFSADCDEQHNGDGQERSMKHFRGFFPSLNDQELVLLRLEITDDEVRAALFEMNP